MNTPRHAVTALGLVLLASTAGAQSVWRCEAAGRVVYQGEPCRGGRAIEPAPQRPEAAVVEAERIAARERSLAEELAVERQQREARPVALAAGIQNPPTELSPPKKPALRKKHPPRPDAGAGTWRAVRPSSPRTPG